MSVSPSAYASLSGGVRHTVSTLRGAPRLLLLISIALLFSISGGLLWSVGLNYDGIAGSALSKIHPGTYVAVLALALAVVSAGQPVAVLTVIIERRPASVVLLAVAAAVLVQTVVRSAAGMAGLVDSYMLPAVVSALLLLAGRDTRYQAEILIHSVFILNAVLALFEFGTKHQLFPYRFDGMEFPDDLRSTALQGHPLVNATLTMTYMLALINGGGALSRLSRASIIGLEALALVAFGGRSALVIGAALAACKGVGLALRVLRRGRISLLAAGIATLAVTILPLVVGGLAVGGFFDAVASRFASDGGSANARVDMLALFQRIPLSDLMLGADPAWVDSLRFSHGLALGIENPIVKTVLYQGVLTTLLLAGAVAFYVRELLRVTGPGAGLPTFAFILVINTFESVATKTTLLAKFAVMIVILFRTERGLGVPTQQAADHPSRRSRP